MACTEKLQVDVVQVNIWGNERFSGHCWFFLSISYFFYDVERITYGILGKFYFVVKHLKLYYDIIQNWFLKPHIRLNPAASADISVPNRRVRIGHLSKAFKMFSRSDCGPRVESSLKRIIRYCVSTPQVRANTDFMIETSDIDG